MKQQGKMVTFTSQPQYEANNINNSNNNNNPMIHHRSSTTTGCGIATTTTTPTTTPTNHCSSSNTNTINSSTTSFYNNNSSLLLPPPQQQQILFKQLRYYKVQVQYYSYKYLYVIVFLYCTIVVMYYGSTVLQQQQPNMTTAGTTTSTTTRRSDRSLSIMTESVSSEYTISSLVPQLFKDWGTRYGTILKTQKNAIKEEKQDTSVNDNNVKHNLNKNNKKKGVIVSKSMVCEKLGVVGDKDEQTTTSTTFRQVWEDQMIQPILNVSLMDTEWSHLRSNPDFVQWMYDSFQYFTYDRLQHTSMSVPIDTTDRFRRIYDIIENKMKHPQTAPSLQIVIFGGSVTAGHDCFHNIFDTNIRNDGKDNTIKGSTDEERKTCSWTGRLQDMMDTVFGKDVIVITNMATGGVRTEISTSVLQFGLLPITNIPDMIIWDHGVNDAFSPIKLQDPNIQQLEWLLTDFIFSKLQSFYQATLDLPMKEPPLVVLLDSFIGHEKKISKISHTLATTSAISKMLSWYPNIWGISYSNTVRPYVYSQYKNSDTILSLLGMKGLVLHPGMMYHISMAWTVIFNFMQVLHDNCVATQIIEQQNQVTDATSSLRKQSQPTTKSQKQMPSTDFYQDVTSIPEITNDLVAQNVSSDWEQRATVHKSMKAASIVKAHQQQTEVGKRIQHSSMTCYYVWMVNMVLHIVSPVEISNVIEPYMIDNTGWTSNHGDSKRSPGWVAQGGTGSTFTLQFDDVPLSVESLTIIHMLSYSKNWVNSTLQVDATFEDVDVSSNTTITESTEQHIISGYHESETSILVTTKLSLTDTSKTMSTIESASSTNMKRLLRLQFQLTGGNTFKIAGMAIC